MFTSLSAAVVIGPPEIAPIDALVVSPGKIPCALPTKRWFTGAVSGNQFTLQK